MSPQFPFKKKNVTGAEIETFQGTLEHKGGHKLHLRGQSGGRYQEVKEVFVEKIDAQVKS